MSLWEHKSLDANRWEHFNIFSEAFLNVHHFLSGNKIAFKRLEMKDWKLKSI